MPTPAAPGLMQGLTYPPSENFTYLPSEKSEKKLIREVEQNLSSKWNNLFTKWHRDDDFCESFSV